MISSHSEDNDSSLCSTDSGGSRTSTPSDNYQTRPPGALRKESALKDDMNEEYLPEVDGGVHAWLFLLAATMLEALVWGKSIEHEPEMKNE
jgi:hypothetical protein